MLLLLETAAGFGLFKVLKEKKLKEAKDLSKDFQTLEKAQKIVQLKAFEKFSGTVEALAATTAIVDSKLEKGLKKFLKKKVPENEELAILDAKLGNLIKEKLGIPCVFSNSVVELARGVKSQLEGLVGGLSGNNLELGLSHSMSRYKLKFSPDKVDTMIIQAVSLLDDLDKELNTYAMRLREWYGWHFPEMAKIVQDNIKYAMTVRLMKFRPNASEIDMSGILEEDVEEAVKAAAQVSMGTEISEGDMENIDMLAEQVIGMGEYRGQLFEYLSSRMQAIAPNLTVLVGELVGARLIAHAGSLMNLAKAPGSTIQILGAEKALFRALKTKKQTPKYGLMFHASLIGQTSAKFKGKIARLVAAKSALASRIDALGEDDNGDIGRVFRDQVEVRVARLEGKPVPTNDNVQPSKYDPLKRGDAMATEVETYDTAGDVVKKDDAMDVEEAPKKEKKKKKKKVKEEVEEDGEAEVAEPEKKKKKKKRKPEAEAEPVEDDDDDATPAPKKEKKKKKKKSKED
ncbi:hypothetical protein BSKO_01391 [Bryopsis sp. KO-2023]|nr:hypothetical protein BSKO_01391 [Bryopsis sp. KO-2023]